MKRLYGFLPCTHMTSYVTCMYTLFAIRWYYTQYLYDIRIDYLSLMHCCKHVQQRDRVSVTGSSVIRLDNIQVGSN
jgi:hypothetical protein